MAVNPPLNQLMWQRLSATAAPRRLPCPRTQTSWHSTPRQAGTATLSIKQGRGGWVHFLEQMASTAHDAAATRDSQTHGDDVFTLGRCEH